MRSLFDGHEQNGQNEDLRMYLWDAQDKAIGWVDRAGVWHDISEDPAAINTPKGVTVTPALLNQRRNEGLT